VRTSASGNPPTRRGPWPEASRGGRQWVSGSALEIEAVNARPRIFHYDGGNLRDAQDGGVAAPCDDQTAQHGWGPPPYVAYVAHPGTQVNASSSRAAAAVFVRKSGPCPILEALDIPSVPVPRIGERGLWPGGPTKIT